MSFSPGQLKLLANLFIDIAKGMFLAAFTVPAISNLATLFSSVRALAVATLSAYLSLAIMKVKESL